MFTTTTGIVNQFSFQTTLKSAEELGGSTCTAIHSEFQTEVALTPPEPKNAALTVALKSGLGLIEYHKQLQ